VLETPEPNLTAGMHWLMSTVATRFNRFRRERGHLFQGRYQALPIEDTAVMGHVVDYVHLNPVRAQVVSAAQVGAFRWSSLSRFLRGARFTELDAQGALGGRGWSDTPQGWSEYVTHLVTIAGNHEKQKRLGYDGSSCGWAIGTQWWRRELVREHAHLARTPGLAADEARVLRDARWRELPGQQLQSAGRIREKALAPAKTAPWKLHLAQRVRDECGAAITWLARELDLGARPGHGPVTAQQAAARRKTTILGLTPFVAAPALVQRKGRCGGKLNGTGGGKLLAPTTTLPSPLTP